MYKFSETECQTVGALTQLCSSLVSRHIQHFRYICRDFENPFRLRGPVL